MNLHFVYVVLNDNWKDRAREEWLYIYRMSKFFQWWLRKNFHLYYTVRTDIMVVVNSALMRLRFGTSDLVRHHKEKGEDIYHFYLSYFKPLISDCQAGYYTDNFGLIKWRYYDKGDKYRFLALENCTKISHVLMHEVVRQRGGDKKYHELIHEQWDKHIHGLEDYEYYSQNFTKVSADRDFMFVTMKIPSGLG